MSTASKRAGKRLLGERTVLFRETRDAQLEAIAPLRRGLTRWAVHAGADQRARDAVALACSEAITNVVVHAYRDGPGVGTVSVRGEMSGPERVQITITDHGGGMTPRTGSPGIGLGLPIIAQLADDLEIDSCAGTGTRVAMVFNLLSGC